MNFLFCSNTNSITKQLLAVLMSFAMLSGGVIAQQVENLHFEQQGKQIHITYDLSGDAREKYTVSVSCSQDGGQRWGLPLTQVTGDVGQNVSVGIGKRIIWEVLAERDRLIGDIMFRVEAASSFSGGKGQFTDKRDGRTYGWVRIGTQIWMSENLNIGKMIDGPKDQKDNGVIETYCYDNKDDNCMVYGGLYQWEEMMGYSHNQSSQGICPEGWHIPTDKEWCTLTYYLDNTVDCNEFGYSGKDVGGKLKVVGTTHWNAHIGGSSNSSGFSALGAGGRSYLGYFYNLRYTAYFWSSSEYSSADGIGRGLAYNNARLYRASSDKAGGFSVRCLRN